MDGVSDIARQGPRDVVSPEGHSIRGYPRCGTSGSAAVGSVDGDDPHLYRAGRHAEPHFLAGAVADERLAYLGLVADASLGGRGLGRSDDHVLGLLAIALDDDLASDLYAVVMPVLVDRDRALQHLLERNYPAFQKVLVVLGLLQLGVLGEIPELHGVVDPLRHLGSALGAQLLELGLQLLQPLGGYVDRLVGVHVELPQGRTFTSVLVPE